MRRNIALVMCSIIMIFGVSISANAQNLINPSFEASPAGSGFNVGWSHTGGGDGDVIDSLDIVPNVAPTNGINMAFVVSSGTIPNGTSFTGGNGFASLATDQLINTGIAETNSSVAQTGSNLLQPITETTVVSYDVSFLAPTNNTCDNYAAVLLIEHSGPAVIADAKCYNSTGNGFIDTANGPVFCSQTNDGNIAHAVAPYQFGGNSGFITDTLTMDILNGVYDIEIVTGQIFDGVCDQAPNTDVGVLVDNFNLLTLNLNGLDPSQAGAQNTLVVDGFTPNGDVSFIYSFNLNTPARVAPDDICLGLDTPLVNPRILTTLQADENGNAAFNFNIPISLVGITAFIQAVDITTCLGSNVNEELIGDTPGGQPPVLLPLNPGTAGQQNTLSATGATPNSDVRFIWSFNAGNESANNICPGFQSGVVNPRMLPIVQSDGAGAASLNVNVPGNLAGISVVLQAVDITTCTGSNVNPETL